jgi:HSP20 family molecular chaperone IbpA
MEVTNASLENGLLNIFVERVIPEEKKPKTIKVK